MSTDTINIRRLAFQDAEAMEKLVNGAFRADQFFKKPEFYNRVSVESIQDASKDEKDAMYLVGTINDTDEVCTCVFTAFYIDICTEFAPPSGSRTETLPITTFLAQGTDGVELNKALALVHQQPESKFTLKFVTSISQVSVSEERQGKGLGKKLVTGVEQFLAKFAPEQFLSQINTTLDRLGLKGQCAQIEQLSRLEVLVAVRPELLGFYGKLGYEVVEENVPFSATHICLPEYRFSSTTMEKPIGKWDQ